MYKRVICFLSAICLFLTFELSAAEVLMVDGTTQKGLVTAQDGKIFLEGKELDLVKVVEISFSKEVAQKISTQHRITLIDGSNLMADIQTGDKSTIKANLSVDNVIEINAQKVRSLSFIDLDPDVTIKSVPDKPYLINKFGKVVEAQYQWINFINVGIMQADQEFKLPKDVVSTLILNAPVKTKNNKGVVLYSRYGDSIVGNIKSVNNKYIVIESIIGDIQFKFFDVINLEVLSDSVLYLTELTPSVELIPADGSIHKPTFNQSMAGGIIRLGPNLVEKGICMQGKSKLNYSLNAGFSRFTFALAYNTSAGISGDFDFVILGDGKELLRKRVNEKSLIYRYEVALKGVNQLTLMIDEGDYGPYGDFGVWVEPKLIK